MKDFFFKGGRLFIPKSGLKGLLILEVHEGALTKHSGIDKTFGLLKEHYIGLRWPRMLGPC